MGFGSAGDEASALFAGDATVPLVRGEGDPAARVPVYVGDAVRTLAWLDLEPGATTRIGALLRIRGGLPEPRRGRVALPEVRVGELALRGLTAEEVDGDELVLALASLPGVGIRVGSSSGTVTFLSAADARAALSTGGPTERWSLPPGPAVLLDADLVVDPTSGRMAARPALQPQWVDADAWWLQHLRDDALFGGEVEGVDFLDATRWGRVGPHAFARGELDRWQEADRNLWRAGADDCDAPRAVAERAIRWGDPVLAGAAADAAVTWAAWRTLSPREREALRQAGEGVDDDCAEIGWLAGGAPWDPVDPWPTARLAWETGDPAAARWALDRGVARPALALVVLDDLVAHGSDAAVRAAASALRGPGPHALTRAVALADRVTLAPETLAERVAAGQVLEPEAVVALYERRPGDPGAACLAAAADPEVEVPMLPEADCLAADLLRARARGDVGGAAGARARLVARWPDVWVDDPDPAGVRVLAGGRP